MIKLFKNNYKLTILVIFLLFVFGQAVRAAVMESENYKIQFDSINSGGERQTSENYIMEDTIGEIATGQSSSESYNLYAGYQQMNETYLSLSDGANVSMSAIDMTNSTSTGGTSWTVIADNPAGYKLEVSAESVAGCDAYLCDADNGNEFADYQEASGTTPEVWNTQDGRYEFGFSAYGDDVADGTWGSGASCGSGTSLPQDLKYRGFNDQPDAGPETIQIASRAARTDSSGITSYFCLGAVQSHTYAPSGTYTATTTVTLTSL